MTTTVREQTSSTSGFGSVGLLRKIAAGVVVAVGLVFIAVTMINSLFTVGPAFEELIDDFRPALADESLAQARSDVAGLDAVGQEFQTAVAPGMADALSVTPEEFASMVQSNYPAVAQGMAALPDITTTFSGLVDTLESQQDLFASADAIPTDDLPATTVPWIITISGILAIVLGVLLFLPGRLWGILTVVLGAALLAGTFALSLPQKAADADKLNENLTPIYTQELIDDANGALAVVAAMGDEMQTEMLPDLAQQLGMSQEDLEAFLAQNFPATAAALQTMGESLQRFQDFVGTFETNLDNYETIQPVTFSPIIWMMVVGGIIIVAAGGYCIIFRT
jgi:hypothetical protein